MMPDLKWHCNGTTTKGPGFATAGRSDSMLHRRASIRHRGQLAGYHDRGICLGNIAAGA